MKLTALMVSMLFLLQSPPGQTQPQPQKGSIEGAIVRIGSNEPIAGARVILARAAAAGQLGVTGPVLPSLPLPPLTAGTTAGAAVSTPLGAIPAVTTDRQGKFMVKDLDAGSYRLTVAANGYARQEYGQRVIGAQGTPISLAAGQAFKDIVVRLTPAGNLTGRVSDDAGLPAVGAQVQLLRASYNANGQKTFQSAGQTRTNDRGEYRLFWVTPGRYYLNAGSPVGPLRPLEAGGAGDSPNGVQESYALTYYPGVSDVREATVIEVQPGVELSAIDLIVPRQQLRRIRGRVIDARTGQRPAAVTMTLSSRSLTGGGFTSSVFAWEALELFAYFDSDLLRRFEAQGKPLHISESERPAVEVKLIPVAP